MASPTPQNEPLLDRIVGSVLGTVSIVLKRLVLHIVALVAAVLLIDVTFGTWMFSEILLKLSIYGGIICLIPYGAVSNPYWWLPVLAGCAQGIALLVLGMPWPLMIFWAGLQTWTVRLLIARGNIGWDWTAAPVLILGLFAYFSTASLWSLPAMPLVSFPVLALAGLAAYRLYVRSNHASLHRQLLAALLVRLRQIVQNRNLTQEEQSTTSFLLSQCEYLAVSNALSEELIDRINAVTDRLEQELRKRSARPLGTLFKSAQWQHLGSRTPAAAGSILEELQALVALLTKLVAAQKAAGAQKPSSPQEDRMQELAGLAARLLEQRKLLPPDLATPLSRIASLSLDMLQSMREDPEDRRSGMAFLGRYLPKIGHIVDEYLRMQTVNPSLPRERTAEVLERLARAFAEEKNGMARNDNINYAAEIDALDSLLKMRGY